MNILIVNPDAGNQETFVCGEHCLHVRNVPSSLKAIVADVAILMPGVTEAQRNLAIERLRTSRDPRLIEL